MSEDTLLPFGFPSLGRKNVVAAFDGGRLTSDGGVMPLAAAERRLGLADKLAALIADPRDPTRVRHGLADILRARIFAIACGYEDGNDLDQLRSNPSFKLACARLPDSGKDLCSRPAISRFENAPTRHEVAAMIDIWCASYPPPAERSQPGHRRHGRCRAWHATTVAVQHASRRTQHAMEKIQDAGEAFGRGW